MARKQPLPASNGPFQGRTKATRPHKLPTIDRGGSSLKWDNQTSNLIVQEEERRVQDELIEMLTVKLAHKEKEIEMLRCKQLAIDRDRVSQDRHVRHEQEQHGQEVGEMKTSIQRLQRQLQVVQSQCEQLQAANAAQEIAILDEKRQREEDQAQARQAHQAHHQLVDGLRREQHQSVKDRHVLENNLQRMLQDQERQSNVIVQLESRCFQLENDIRASHETNQQLNEAVASEKQRRHEVERRSRRIDEEKVALQEKQRALMKTLKGASSRAATVEKKRSELIQVEDQLTEQLAALQKENHELKARKGQMSSHTKHLQARIAALENARNVYEKKLEDTIQELETARKYCRESQFRTKQLQEEMVLLTNRKPPTNLLQEPSDTNDSALDPQDEHQVSEETQATDDMPCWMKCPS